MSVQTAGSGKHQEATEAEKELSPGAPPSVSAVEEEPAPVARQLLLSSPEKPSAGSRSVGGVTTPLRKPGVLSVSATSPKPTGAQVAENKANALAALAAQKPAPKKSGGPPPPRGPPPPPPPPPPGGAKGWSAVRNVVRKQAVGLNWSGLSTAQAASTIWAVAVDSETIVPAAAIIDAAQLESLFAKTIDQNASKSGAKSLGDDGSKAGPADCGAAGKKKQPMASTLAPARANNIAIVLARFPLTDSQIVSVIGASEDGLSQAEGCQILPLTEEQINSLLSILPTETEIAAVKRKETQLKTIIASASSDNQMGPSESLDRAERFISAMASAGPTLSSKLRAMRLGLTLEDTARHVSDSLDLITTACSELSGSGKFRRLLQVILELGNALNQMDDASGGKGRRKLVHGFRLSELGRLATTKSLQPAASAGGGSSSTAREVEPKGNGGPKISLLDYLARLLASKEPQLLQFCDHEMRTLRKVVSKGLSFAGASAEIDALKSEVASLGLACSPSSSASPLLGAAESGPAPGGGEAEAGSPQAAVGKRRCELLEQKLGDALGEYQHTATLFGEGHAGSGSSDGTPMPLGLFGAVADFSKQLQAAAAAVASAGGGNR